MINKQLFELIGDKKIYIYFITTFSVISFVANLAITTIIVYSLYLVSLSQITWVNVGMLTTIVLICLIIKHVMSLLIQVYINKIGDYVKQSLRERCYEKILDTGLNHKDANAKLMQLSIEGIEQLDTYYSLYLPQLFYAMVTPLLMFLVIVFIEYKTALVLLACLPLIPVAIIIVKKKADKTFHIYWEKYKNLGNTFLDYLQGMKEIKVFQDEKRKRQDVIDSSENFRKVTMKVLVMQLSSITIMDLVAFGGAAIAIVMTLFSAQNNQISAFYALFIILISAEYFLPMRSLGSAFHVGMNGLTAGKNILGFLATKMPKTGNISIDGIKHIKVDHVKFYYDESHEIFADLSLDIKKGLNAIVGRSGVGKSTIVNLLTCTNQMITGAIYVNGYDIRDIDLRDYYKRLALVTSHDYIFNDTIRNNFLFKHPTATDHQIKDALKRVNLTDLIAKNQGLDYKILEDAENISGGQRQRLSLAINLLGDKDLYIIDEATSNIDTESEKIIMENVIALAKTKMVVLISHRLHNVVSSDCIYYLDNKLIQSGTHENLMQQKGNYYALFNEQIELELGYKVNDHEA
ncbi:MAG: ABC transporter ATP-binding protein/permease [Tenericutes bacterium]|nr:ABC transporter ATP-binding protein/permease [Mycoplasmatota bacterium]